MWNLSKIHKLKGDTLSGLTLKGLTLIGVFLGVSLLATQPILASAQTASDTTQQAEETLKKAVTQQTVFSAASVALTDLIEQEPTPITLSFKTVNDLPADVSAEGVTIRGFSQYVEVNGQLVGQVIITGLEKDGKTATLDPNSFNAQFELEEAELTTDLKIDVEGDRAALIEALRLLTTEEKEEEEEKEEVKSGNEQAQSAANGAINESASDYETPERLEATPDPTLTAESTINGCSVRIDYAQLVAIQQSKMVFYTNGVQSSEEECSDSEVRYALQQSYDVCSDNIDMTAMTATAQFTWYYVDGGQSRNDVSDCESNPEKVFEIVEKQSCSVQLDFTNEVAVIQTALIYNNINGVETKVRDCEASISIDPLPMELNTGTCAIKHDFPNDRSEEMGSWIYDYEGIIYQATLCTDTGVNFSHTDVYKTSAGADLCSTFIDLDDNTALTQYRTQITVDGQDQFITECTPDEGNALSIQATTAGCEDPFSWEHDIAGGVSYGTQRFFYENPTRVYVTECIRSDVTYDHDLMTTGYQNHDDVKASYALATVSINVDTVDYEVATSQVIPGSPLIPYSYQTVSDIPISSSYSGCDVVRTTERVEVYLRPDGTEYYETIGVGSPIGPLNVCGSVAQAPIWKKIKDQEPVYIKKVSNVATQCLIDQGANNQVWTSCKMTAKQWERQTTYQGTRKLNREDGAVITQTSSTNVKFACETLLLHQNRSPKNDISATPAMIPAQGIPILTSLACPTNYTGDFVYSWNQSEGW